MPIPQIWYGYGPFPHPTLVKVVKSRLEMIHPDFNIVFFGGGEGGIFVVASAFMSFILMSIFLNIFVEDCNMY